MIHNQKIQGQQTPIEPWQGRLPFFYGWVIVAVGFLMGFIAGGAFWAASVIAIPMTTARIPARPIGAFL